MDKSTAVSFSYAKAAGLLSKSFIKDRTQRLFQVESLADLWTLLFKEPAPLVPETLLARELEENGVVSGARWEAGVFDRRAITLYESRSLSVNDTVLSYEDLSRR